MARYWVSVKHIMSRVTLECRNKMDALAGGITEAEEKANALYREMERIATFNDDAKNPISIRVRLEKIFDMLSTLRKQFNEIDKEQLIENGEVRFEYGDNAQFTLLPIASFVKMQETLLKIQYEIGRVAGDINVLKGSNNDEPIEAEIV